MVENHTPARADILRSYALKTAIGASALAMVLTGSTNQETTFAEAPNLTVKSAPETLDDPRPLFDELETSRTNSIRPSRSKNRASALPTYCWYGTTQEIKRATNGNEQMTAKRKANIALACKLATKESWLKDNPETNIKCLVQLWDRESGWKTNDKYGNAYGIPQALPGDKMATTGNDWRTNPATQIKWGFSYIKSRYKNPCNAWEHYRSNSWY